MIRLCLILFLVLFTTLGCTQKSTPKMDDSINLVIIANIKGLDPMLASDVSSNTVVGQIYEGLLRYNYLKRPFTLEPNLAESMPLISKDGLTVTFKLRPHIYFQDDACFENSKGREVFANDFIYSWKRLADPANQSDGFWIFDDKIVGFNEWAEAKKNGKADYKTEVEGLKAVDKYTLVIKLKKPYYQLLSVLAMNYSTVVPVEAVQKYGEEFLNKGVGTGPYKLESWIRGSKVILIRNENYHESAYPMTVDKEDIANKLNLDSGQKTPFVKRLTFTELIEDQPRWQNFMTGKFDTLAIPNDNFDFVIKDDELRPEFTAKGFSLSKSPSMWTSFYGFNMQDPILGKNKELRQAIALAYDAKTYLKKFANNAGIVAEGPVPPGLESYDPNYKNPYQTHDIAKAKDLLKKAGYPEGKGLPEFSIDVTSDTKARQEAEYFMLCLAEIGVKIKINVNSWPQLLDKIKAYTTQVFYLGWSADYPDPQNYFQLFYSKNFSPGPNSFGFKNEEFDQIYEKTLALPAGSEREILNKKLRDIVVEESPLVLVIHPFVYSLQHGWLKNFKYNDVSLDYPQYYKIDLNLKQELLKKL